MDKTKLGNVLKELAHCASKVYDLCDEVDHHCMEKYGVTPGDVDCDDYLDACTGAGGRCSGMTVGQFDESMRNAIALHGI